MHTARRGMPLVAAGLLALGGCAMLQSDADKGMSFFVTSAGPGNGGDLGGLEGADRHCQSLAAAGAGSRTWRAYLSTQGSALNDPKVAHARDRIGAGPWYNAKGVRIARNVEDLHSAKNNVNNPVGCPNRVPGGAVLGLRFMSSSKCFRASASRSASYTFSGRFKDAAGQSAGPSHLLTTPAVPHGTNSRRRERKSIATTAIVFNGTTG